MDFSRGCKDSGSKTRPHSDLRGGRNHGGFSCAERESAAAVQHRRKKKEEDSSGPPRLVPTRDKDTPARVLRARPGTRSAGVAPSGGTTLSAAPGCDLPSRAPRGRSQRGRGLRASKLSVVDYRSVIRECRVVLTRSRIGICDSAVSAGKNNIRLAIGPSASPCVTPPRRTPTPPEPPKNKPSTLSSVIESSPSTPRSTASSASSASSASTASSARPAISAPTASSAPATATRPSARVALVESLPSVTEPVPNSTSIPAARTRASASATTGVRVLQLNMRRSAVVSGEVRELVSRKRLDVLLLQEPYVREQGATHTFCGLESGMRVAAVRSQRPWAAVAVCNPDFQMLFVSQLSTTHCVCAEVQAPSFSFYVASCYFQHRDEIEPHLSHLEKVCSALRGKRLLIALDANARSSLWGPQSTDDRGEPLEDLIRSFGLSVVNDVEQPPTYWTERGSSYIDVTLASATMNQFIGDWKVRCDWTTSDHNSVDVRLRVPKATGNGRPTANSRFDTRRADWEQFDDRLTDLSESRLEVLDLTSPRSVEVMADTLTGVIIDSCAASMPRKRNFRKSNPWWTSELTKLKKAAYRKRRALQLGQDEPTSLARMLEYRTSLRKYSREVRKAKLASWRRFVTSHGNSEPWGFAYKSQAGKLRVERVLSTLRCGETSTMTLEETARHLLEVHVPDDREDEDTQDQRVLREEARIAPGTADASPFSREEVAVAVRKFKNNKAPGPDLIEVCVLKRVFATIPGQLVRLFNGCLQWGVFPSAWKEGSLRVLLKGGDKDEKDPKSYRPICLLSVVGKLFERLLLRRLTTTCLAPGKVSDRQFGFTPGKSAEGAIVELRRVVSAIEQRYAVGLLFDISGAFDNVWWPLVLDSLKSRDCPANVFGVLQSYFDGRRVKIPLSSEEVSKRATKGCPQGSVLGPACWNLMFDGLLQLLEESGQEFVAYADDLIVVVSGETRRELEIKGQQVVDQISSWCSSAKLKISAAKTEAVILKSGWIKRAVIGSKGGARPDRKRKALRSTKADLSARPPTIRLGDKNISFRSKVKYLGVYFDNCMGVRSHCSYIREKVGSLFAKLGRLAGSTWGLRYRALSTIYQGVFVPTVTYAAAGWSDLCGEGDLNVLRSAQRQALIAVTRAYRTASWESLCVVAGAVPVCLRLAMRRALFTVRLGKDAEMGGAIIPAGTDRKDATGRVSVEALNMWQARWTSSTKGRTTSAFFPDIHQRMQSRWLAPDHCTTQVLTGHGDFGARLVSLGLASDPACECGGGDDTVGHLLMECPRFDPQREALRAVVPTQEWEWPRAAQYFVSSEEAFSLFRDYCRDTLWLKGGYYKLE